MYMVGSLRLEEVSISKGFCLRRKKTNKLLQPNNNEGGCEGKGKQLAPQKMLFFYESGTVAAKDE
jgi:hypothetical protein